jgi:hypothetical protein
MTQICVPHRFDSYLEAGGDQIAASQQVTQRGQ